LWRGIPEQNIPVECWDWVEAKTIVEAGYGVEIFVIGGYLGHLVENTEGLEDVIGKLEVHDKTEDTASPYQYSIPCIPQSYLAIRSFWIG
jgi:hypothetical protein